MKGTITIEGHVEKEGLARRLVCCLKDEELVEFVGHMEEMANTPTFTSGLARLASDRARRRAGGFIPPPIQKLGDIIRDARISQGVSQTDLAEKIGLRQPSLSRIETNTVNPRISTIRRVEAELGIEILRGGHARSEGGNGADS